MELIQHRVEKVIVGKTVKLDRDGSHFTRLVVCASDEKGNPLRLVFTLHHAAAALEMEPSENAYLI